MEKMTENNNGNGGVVSTCCDCHTSTAISRRSFGSVIYMEKLQIINIVKLLKILKTFVMFSCYLFSVKSILKSRNPVSGDQVTFLGTLYSLRHFMLLLSLGRQRQTVQLGCNFITKLHSELFPVSSDLKSSQVRKTHTVLGVLSHLY